MEGCNVTEQGTEKIKIWRLTTKEWDRSYVLIEWLEADRTSASSYWLNGRRCHRVTTTSQIFMTFAAAQEAAMERVSRAVDDIKKKLIDIVGAVDAVKSLRPDTCKQSTSRW